jgi:hypothetical protein
LGLGVRVGGLWLWLGLGLGLGRIRVRVKVRTKTKCEDKTVLALTFKLDSRKSNIAPVKATSSVRMSLLDLQQFPPLCVLSMPSG